MLRKKAIDEHREKLHDLLDEMDDLKNPEIVEESKRLDEIILDYYKHEMKPEPISAKPKKRKRTPKKESVEKD